MIQLFTHYVPRRSIVLATLEALVLLMAAYVGISLDLAGSGAAIPGATAAMPSQAFAFALGMMIIMSSMGLYQPTLWDNTASIRARLYIAFLLGFAITGLVSYLMPSPYPRPLALGATILLVGLAGSVIVRAAFHKWTNLGAFKSRVLVLGTGSRVMKLAEHSQRNSHHQVVGYVSLQPSRHYVPSGQVLPMAPGESLLSVGEKSSIDQLVVAVRDRRAGGFPVQQLLECRMKGVKVIELPTFI